jgi:hypothetical protein
VLDYSQASGSNVVHAHLTCPTTDGSPCVNSTLVPGAKNEIQQLEWDPSCSLAGSTTCQTIWYTGFSGLLGEVRFDPGTGNVLATKQFPVPAATSRDWPTPGSCESTRTTSTCPSSTTSISFGSARRHSSSMRSRCR